MGQIKTYSIAAFPNDALEGFSCNLMQRIYANRNGQSDEPHRHSFYTILFVQEGSGKHIIDFNEFKLNSNQVYFISPGQVHQIIEDKASKGYVFTFDTDFLVRNHIDLHFLEDINLFNNYGYSPPLQLNDQQKQDLRIYSESIFSEWENPNPDFAEATIASWLKLFLIKCNQSCTLHSIDSQHHDAASTIFKNFKNEVDLYYKEEHQVRYYADKLHLSPDHLNKTTKSLIGINAKSYISSRLDTEAKRLLLFSGMNTKEISYELGFKEIAHFSNFFKKMNDRSPTDFIKIYNH